MAILLSWIVGGQPLRWRWGRRVSARDRSRRREFNRPAAREGWVVTNRKSPSDTDARPWAIDEQQRVFLDALSRRHRGALTAFFRRRPNFWQDSEDMAQEVFMRLARREGGAEIENAEHYLFQIARSVLADNARRRGARRGAYHEPYSELEHAVEDFSPERVLEGKEQVRRVLNALEDLPDNVRAAFMLHRFEDLTYAEIAARLGVSVSSVEKYVIRALKAMTARVKEGE